MDETIYVTADGIYSDIDIYACSIAYSQLLQLQGLKAIPVINTNFTDSVTNELRQYETQFANQIDFDFSKANKLVILDRSETENLRQNIDLNKIVEIYDHHFGYEEFWSKKLGKNSHIEKVGSCATLIWEEYEKRGFTDNLRPETGKLLYAAIISNTLNLQATVTDQRDIKAAASLREKCGIDPEFDLRYFSAISKSTSLNPLASLEKDTKLCHLENLILAIGQLEVWEGKTVANILTRILPESLTGFENTPWMANIVSIKDKKTFFISPNRNIINLLRKIYDTSQEENIMILDKLLLRKELIRDLKEHNHG